MIVSYDDKKSFARMYTKTLNNSQQNYSYTITNNVINLGYIDYANLVFIRFELIGSDTVDLLFFGTGRGYTTIYTTNNQCVVTGIHYNGNCKITDNSNHNVNKVNDLCILNFHYK